jgi:hypothetical protein
MVGDIEERAQVNRLWYGCRPDIQKELWMNLLNPEVSDFETVAADAETIELANNVAERNQPQVKPDGNGKGKVGKNKPSHPPAHQHEATSTKAANTKLVKPTESFDKDKKHFAKKKHLPKHLLSDQERAELKAQGKCFRRKGEGHMSRNCPENNVVHNSGRSDRPPGIRNNALDIDLNELTLVEELADATETLENLTLSSMIVAAESQEDEGIGSDSFGETQAVAERIFLPRFRGLEQMEDPIGVRVEMILDAHAPFPGDENAPGRYGQGSRFVCYQVLDRNWLVMDSWWMTEEGDSLLNLDQVLHPLFDVADGTGREE